jgi:excisionase family DNA binding protein
MEIRQKAKERGMADEELRGRESRQRPPREITVSEAAAALRVSERTVLNFIKEKRIKAVKVGKKWFVDAQSVRDLASGGGRSGVMPPFGGEFSANAANSEFSAFAEKSEIAETKMRKNFSENSANSENTENTEIAEKGTSGSTLPRARGLEVSALELVFGVRQAGVVGMPAAKRNGCL